MADISKEILRLAGDRTKLVDKILEELENRVGTAEEDLLRKVIDDFVDKLDKDDTGNIKNTLANKRKIALLDKVYTAYNKDSGIKIVEAIVDGVNQVMNFSGRYYSIFSKPAELGVIMTDTRATIQDWLGITKKGGLVENGYLNRLLTDQTVKNTIRDSTFKAVISGRGYNEVKKGLRDYIAGTPDKAGALKQYHRNFVYDTFSQVDRTQSKIIADKLKLRYAIYEGGLVKKSRKFCRDRNGKVFTDKEIEMFDPPVAKPPNYNPFTDLGGYGCRHHLNWIPKAIAIMMRPDLAGTE